MKKLAIYDMDGTIVCSQHRYRAENNKIDLDFWIENAIPDKIEKDSLLPHSYQYFKDLADMDTILIIATARTMQKNDANFQYISENLGNPNYIVHRQKNDTRKGVDLKTSGIMDCVKNLADIETITIYEDNQEYLQGMTEFFEAKNKMVYPVFVPSDQGH